MFYKKDAKKTLTPDYFFPHIPMSNFCQLFVKEAALCACLRQIHIDNQYLKKWMPKV